MYPILGAIAVAVAMYVTAPHALEAVAQGGVGSGSGAAAQNLAVESRLSQHQAQIGAQGVLIQQLQNEVEDLKDQLQDLNQCAQAMCPVSATTPTSPTEVSGCPFRNLIIGDALSYNLADELRGLGCDLSKPIELDATVESGAIIGTYGKNNQGKDFSFTTGTGYASGSDIKLKVSPGAHIIGAIGWGANGGTGCEKGLPGGTAFVAEAPITLINQGIIAGGGGGGARNGCNGCNWAGAGGVVSGGGVGAGVRAESVSKIREQQKYFAARWSWNTAGKGAGGGANAGMWGEPGGNSSCGSKGGAPGAAVNGNNFINWSGGQGTVYGAIQ